MFVAQSITVPVENDNAYDSAFLFPRLIRPAFFIGRSVNPEYLARRNE